MTKSLSGVALAMVSAMAFGLLPAVTLPLMAKGLNAISILFYRFLTAAALVGVYLTLTRSWMRLNRAQWRDLGILACLPYAGCALCLFLSYGHIASGVATTLHFLYPVFVAALMAALFGERFRRRLWVGMGLSIAGVALLGLGGESGRLSAVGLIEVIASAVLYAAYVVGVNRGSLSGLKGMQLCFWVFLGCAALIGSYAAVTGKLMALGDASSLGYVVAGALVPTVASNLCLVAALKRIGSTATAMLGCLEALTAVVVGAVVFGEAMGTRVVVGVALVLAAVLWVICVGARGALAGSDRDSAGDEEDGLQGEVGAVQEDAVGEADLVAEAEGELEGVGQSPFEASGEAHGAEAFRLARDEVGVIAAGEGSARFEAVAAAADGEGDGQLPAVGGEEIDAEVEAAPAQGA